MKEETGRSLFNLANKITSQMYASNVLPPPTKMQRQWVFVVVLKDLRDWWRAQLVKPGEDAGDGARRITLERARQIDVERWSAFHDDRMRNGELTQAAIAYAIESLRIGEISQIRKPKYWPFNRFRWKSVATGRAATRGGMKRITNADAIRMLEKSGALIAAEIDRRTRIEEERIACREKRKAGTKRRG